MAARSYFLMPVLLDGSPPVLASVFGAGVPWAVGLGDLADGGATVEPVVDLVDMMLSVSVWSLCRKASGIGVCGKRQGREI